MNLTDITQPPTYSYYPLSSILVTLFHFEASSLGTYPQFSQCCNPCSTLRTGLKILPMCSPELWQVTFILLEIQLTQTKHVSDSQLVSSLAALRWRVFLLNSVELELTDWHQSEGFKNQRLCKGAKVGSSPIKYLYKAIDLSPVGKSP